MRVLLLVAACGAFLSGCAVFNPYDSEFMCSATDDYGRCLDVDGAYAEAVEGRKNPPRRNGKAVVDDATADEQDGMRHVQETRAYSAYKDSEYREMRKLLDAPVTPLVKPPKVLRTLITAYPSNDRTLYTPRYVFFFADEGQFVLGDYLNAAPPARDEASLQPFGAP
jgi:conjugal transfer pilus assembly protein TraV